MRKTREIWTADCETDPFKKRRLPSPFIWGTYNGQDFITFRNTTDFINFIIEKPIIIYAHNAGKFDWHFILNEIEPFSKVQIINGRLARFKIGECEFRDSYNILPIPLSQYQKTEIDYWKFEKEVREQFMPEIISYLKDDCVFLHEIVSAFIKEFGLNLTLASTALKQWAKIEHVRPPQSTSNFYHSLKPYYYGGRVQCFYTGEFEGNFSVADVNSAYPKAMTEWHPYGTEFITSAELPEIGIEQTFIKLVAPATGAFPFRTQEGLLFPDDGREREFNITGWEYVAAKELNLLKEHTIKSVIEFQEKITFKNYVAHFFNKKAEAEKAGDRAGRLFAKLMLNSLYGKFAACPEDYEEYMVIDPAFIAASGIDGWNFCGLLGNWAIISRPLSEDKQHFYNVAVGASITGNQRARLLRAIHAVENPLYCDTDSIACTALNNLEIGKELGQWSIEANCDYAAIAGRKLYAFHSPTKLKDGSNWKKATKGVRLDEKDIIKIARGETVFYEPETPTFSYNKNPSFIPRKIVLTKKDENAIL